VFWRLRDLDGHALSTRPSHIRPLWARLGRGIADFIRASGLPVDDHALTLERLARLPESLNSKAQSKVVYSINYDGGGSPVSYTLPELARWFNVPETFTLTPSPIITRSATVTRLAECKQVDSNALAEPYQNATPSGSGLALEWQPRPTPARASGQRAVRDRRLRDLETLMELRGGRYKDGVRNHAATLFAALTRGCIDHVARVSGFARDRCSPRLTPFEVRGALKAFAKRWFKISDFKIGQWLEVTVAEAANLEGGDKYLTLRVPKEAPAKVERKRRREMISEICAARGRVTLEQIKGLLRDGGCESNVETIRTDLRDLGITDPRRHHRELDTPTLSLFPLEDITTRAKRDFRTQALYICKES
jgi:hypothetical protein